MKRPKRLNYPNGIYGDVSYTKQLNKYITYLENKNKALQLQQTDIVGRSEQLKALLEKLLNENMCSVVGDELIEEALKGF